MTGYTKLFGSIVASTIWREAKETKIVWITMLAMANKNGVVEASIPGLAHFSQVTVEECEIAIKTLSSPDPYSRTKDCEGRRIEPIDGGWRLINHGKYREKMNADERREYLRLKQEEWRKKHSKPKTNPVNTASTDLLTVVDSSTLSTHAEAYSYPYSDPVQPPLIPLKGDNMSSNGKWTEARIVIHFLNEQTGRHFRELQTNLSIIEARLKEPGVTLDGVKAMVTRQCLRWKGTEQEEYLRPETLFGKTKFDSYYAARDIPIASKSGTSTGNLTTEAKIREIQQIVKRATA